MFPIAQFFMSIYDQYPDESLSRLETLETELAELRVSYGALQTQNQMLKGFISLSNVSTGRTLIRATLQKNLDMSIKQAGAELGSLFLLDRHGRVLESILARGATDQTQKRAIVGQVLDKGLAGWVRENRRTGLVTDTQKDFRWLHLPEEPYQAGSALGVPVVWGEELMAIMTLMHSQTHRFSEETARAMEQTAELFALVLNSVRLRTRSPGLDLGTQSQEDWLGEILHYFPTIIWILDHQGVVLKCGGRYLGAIAMDNDQSVGQSVYRLFADAPELTQLVSHALAGNGIESAPFSLGESSYEAWFAPVFDHQNQLIRLLGLILPS